MPVPGVVRLALELALFAAGVALLAVAGRPALAAVFDGAIVLHYAVSYDRIVWLLGR